MGKTRLVEQAFTNSSTNLVLASAKFDDSQSTTPLQAWVDVTSCLLHEMERDRDFRIHLYKSFQLSSEASADYLSILTSIPLLGERLLEYFEVRPDNYRGMVTTRKSKESFRSFEMPNSGDPSKPGLLPQTFKTTIEANTAEKDHSFERLKLAYRELYRVFCRYIPVVLFMDDIQWGEPDEYRIMDTLLDDPELELRLIFVAAHRPVSMVHTLSLVKKPGKRYCKTIPLGPLAPFEISEILCKLLRRADDDVVELVTLVEQKTNGNPFFLVQYMHALEDKGLLYYSTENSRWEWDMKRIQKKASSISDNVLEIVAKKMKKEKKLAKVLSLAAFLGSTQVSVKVMTWIMEEEVDGIE
jgi:predicted ATPase